MPERQLKCLSGWQADELGVDKKRPLDSKRFRSTEIETDISWIWVQSV